LYSYINGVVTHKTNDTVVLENNGIGYNINTSLSTLSCLTDNNKQVKLYTYLYVREDIFSLYGFISQDELKMFLLLISVSGVGPKAALSIISTISPSKFSLCVITDDSKALTAAQGVGPKLAQRIILELKDKIKKTTLETDFQNSNLSDATTKGFDKPLKDAIEALLVLGYRKDSAYEAVKSNYQEGIELEALIKNSLKFLAR
jgi:Holliday junction DNA helicase RuvA